MTRYTVYFGGHVQGVWFRATAQRLAAGRDVAGYVRNLPDGQVLLVAEGTREVLAALIADIDAAMEGNIQEKRIDETPATGEFGDPGDGLTIHR
ncbi:MAG: acylphosphatase [Phycisphaeraceae bacterium]|jgi:acylphosphatase|nr:acylphosphatase [Phycisphaeraceae bacterium]